MKYLLFGRPYGLGMSWQERSSVIADSHLEALKSLEFGDEKFYLHGAESRSGTLGRVSEWLALTEAEFEQYNTEFGLRYPASVG